MERRQPKLTQQQRLGAGHLPLWAVRTLGLTEADLSAVEEAPAKRGDRGLGRPVRHAGPGGKVKTVYAPGNRMGS